MSKNIYPTMRINGKKYRVHRYVMQEFLGRALESYEHVYHKDGDPKNNSIENLVLIIKKMSV